MFQNCDTRYYVYIKINTSGYNICKVLSQMILDDFGHRHLIIHDLHKNFLAIT